MVLKETRVVFLCGYCYRGEALVFSSQYGRHQCQRCFRTFDWRDGQFCEVPS